MRNVPCSLCLSLLVSATILLPTLVRLENFTVGYIPHMHGGNGGQGLMISGALSYAINLINNSTTLLSDHHLSFIYNDSRGNILNTTRAVIDQWVAGAIAIFGPEHSCEIEATVAAALNLAMISYKCADAKPSKKSIFSTFARTHPSSTKIVNSVIALLQYYRWNKFSLIYEDILKYHTVVEYLESKLTINNFTMMNKVTYSRNKPVDYQFISIVKRTSNTTRVYVLFGGRDAVFELLDSLTEQKLLRSGEYVVIYVDQETYDVQNAFEYFWHPVDNRVKGMHKPNCETQRSLLVIVQTPGKMEGHKEFTTKVNEYNKKPPFNIQTNNVFKIHIPLTAVHLFDAVMIYAEALDEVLKTNGDPKNGTLIIQHIISRKKYTSISGAEMRIDENGEVDGNFSLLALQPRPPNITLKANNDSTHIIYPVGVFELNEDSQELTLHFNGKIDWVAGKPPNCEPPCGFNGTACMETPNNSRQILATILASILVVIFVSTSVIYRNWKYEQEIAGLLWQVCFSELEQVGKGKMVQCPSKISMMSEMSVESKGINQIFTKTAMYRGTVVAIKELHYSRRITDIPRKVKKEMKIMRELRHDNINSFIGACVEPTAIYLLTEYCSKGSLQDILENDDFKLDNIFIASLVFDLIKGLMFIHESEIKVHGNLKSSNCVVTSRWVLQVTDFGLYYLRDNAETGSIADHEYYRNLLWKSPELLRNPSTYRNGTQKADIYAFGIILHEIIYRQGPFGGVDLSPKDIIEKVKNGYKQDGVPFRPCIRNLEYQDYILQTMEEAWHEYPELRPEIRHVKSRLRKMTQGMKSNIMDNMMELMEKYANNLEELVDERTALLVEEKKKTVALLHRMLPTSVAAQLIRGEPVIPESFDAVTIYFSDIVGFTEMSANSTPMEVVNFLNDLYTIFDAIIAHYDVYKVETIGDAYMVVSGLPIRNGERHASEISSMALELLSAIKTFKIRHRPNQILKLRIGIHTGPVVAGVVGLTMPRYCLFGDTVNTASRMESNGEPLKIHISPSCKQNLEKLGGYEMESRGLIKMKGKAEMETFWLLGHTGGFKLRYDLSKLSLPQPLFVVSQERKSPKLTSEHRRGSLIPQLDNTNPSSHEDHNFRRNGSVHGFQPYLRLSQNSPRLSRRYSPHSLRDSKILRHCERDIKNEETSSCGDVRNHSNDHRYVKPMRNSLTKKNEEVINNPSICPLTCQNCNSIPQHGKNGIVTLDDTLKPLLDLKRDISPCRRNSKRYLKSRLLKLPSKAWRSCDDSIISPSDSRSSLKDFLSKHISKKLEQAKNKTTNSSLEAETSQAENIV